jgi:4-deoxy-L-threo-5-hexosulose-uronate ketol-isomerase
MAGEVRKKMEQRYTPTDQAYSRMTTEEMRKAFLLDRLFAPGTVSMSYCDTDRAIVGGAVPVREPLPLLAAKKEMAAEYFLERREVGIVNIGGAGVVRADGAQFELSPKDMLYVGRGVRKVEFESVDAKNPAFFYFASFPAHKEYPAAHGKFANAEPTRLGSAENCNRRTIYKYIHPAGIRSCQLVMGLTELETGSVWNTFPPHTHQRRAEIYLYFGLDPESMVVHLMGKPEETRSLIVRDRQAVISPSWSIHCAAATRSYSFVWAMGGENQDFSDMDAVPLKDIF